MHKAWTKAPTPSIVKSGNRPVYAKRYAEVDRHMPFVASITITPIAKG